MACDCVVTATGYAVLFYLAYKLFTAAYNVIFPYMFAVPQNLQVLAGAKWAGGWSFGIF